MRLWPTQEIVRFSNDFPPQRLRASQSLLSPPIPSQHRDRTGNQRLPLRGQAPQMPDGSPAAEPGGAIGEANGAPGARILHVIPVSAISARTGSSPPVTYWERHYGQLGSDNRLNFNSVWRNLLFTLNLRTTRSGGYRFFNLYCRPSPPLGVPADSVQISWSLGLRQAVLVGVGERAGETYIDLRLSGVGTVLAGPKLYQEYRRRWTIIIDNLRDALRQPDAVMDMRVVLQNSTNASVLQAFFEQTEIASNQRMRIDIGPRTMASLPTKPRTAIIEQRPTAPVDLGVAIRQRPTAPVKLEVAMPVLPGRPQTNPDLDPHVYDPFPGVPVVLGEGRQTASETSGEASRALAALELSDDADSERETTRIEDGENTESTSDWSFLGKSRGQVQPVPISSTSSSSSSSGQAIPLQDGQSTSPFPRATPVVIKLESDTDLDEQQRPPRKTKVKKKRKPKGTEDGVEKPKKKKKKRREVVVVESEPEVVRPRRKKGKKKRTPTDAAPDSDIEMASDPTPRTKKKKSQCKAPPISDSDFETTDPPPPPPPDPPRQKSKSKTAASLPAPSPPPSPSPRRRRKRKHTTTSESESESTLDPELGRARIKKRIAEIDMARHELRVEEEELKAKLHRLDFMSRRDLLDAGGSYRAHCVCGACGKYGHKRNSVVCEMHPDAIRIAAWRARGR